MLCPSTFQSPPILHRFTSLISLSKIISHRHQCLASMGGFISLLLKTDASITKDFPKTFWQSIIRTSCAVINSYLYFIHSCLLIEFLVYTHNLHPHTCMCIRNNVAINLSITISIVISNQAERFSRLGQQPFHKGRKEKLKVNLRILNNFDCSSFHYRDFHIWSSHDWCSEQKH